MQNAKSDQHQVPIELERAIFEMAADIRPLSIPTFMLVARRVKEWVKPLLYRTIPVCEENGDVPEGHLLFRIDTLLDMIQSGIFPGDAVRNLLIQVDGDRTTLLSACPNTENLWINADLGPNLFPQISVFPLKRLTCNLMVLFGPERPMDFTYRLFSRLTHLEILDSMLFNASDTEVDPKMLLDLAVIPHLSHLAFAHVEDFSDVGFIDFFLPLLRGCKSLRLLIVFDPYVHILIPRHKDKEELVRDERFVVMENKFYTKEWILGAHTGIDYWSRADDFVAKRRSGEIDALEYTCGPKPQLEQDDEFSI
ncbi:hypothetical protein MVEN_00889800 [Mycena venus]|uniref:Uncharacterized protein n=1 Tax=Mycena venus TaxID=2733690 RepID=A0A8H6YFV7_9AGAR|nr:hypothetical protein MVEN_00889800 [Mycena venus]